MNKEEKKWHGEITNSALDKGHKKESLYLADDGKLSLAILIQTICRLPSVCINKGQRIEEIGIDSYFTSPSSLERLNEKNGVAAKTREGVGDVLLKYLEKKNYLTDKKFFADLLMSLKELHKVDISFYENDLLANGGNYKKTMELMIEDAWKYPELIQRVSIAYKKLKLPNEIYILFLTDIDIDESITSAMNSIRKNRPYDITVDYKEAGERVGLYDLIYIVVRNSVKSTRLSQILDAITHNPGISMRLYKRADIRENDLERLDQLCDGFDISDKEYSDGEMARFLIMGDIYKDIYGVMEKSMSDEDSIEGRYAYLKQLLSEGKTEIAIKAINCDSLKHLVSLHESDLDAARRYCKEYIKEKELYLSIIGEASDDPEVKRVYDELESLAINYQVKTDILLAYSKYLARCGLMTEAIKKAELLNAFYECEGEDNDKALYDLYYHLGLLCDKVMNFKKADIYYQRAEQHTCGEHEKFELIQKRVHIYWREKQYPVAERLIKSNINRVKVLYKKQADLYFNILAQLYLTLGNINHAYSKLTEADDLFKQAEDIWGYRYAEQNNKKYGDNIEGYVTLLTNMGILYRRMGIIENSKKKYEMALEKKKKLYNKNPQEYAISLGITYTNMACMEWGFARAFYLQNSGKTEEEQRIATEQLGKATQLATHYYDLSIKYKEEVIDKEQKRYYITMYWSYIEYAKFCRYYGDNDLWESILNHAGSMLAKAFIGKNAAADQLTPDILPEDTMIFDLYPSSSDDARGYTDIIFIARYWYEKGWFYLKKNDYDSCKKYLEKAYKICEIKAGIEPSCYIEELADYSFTLANLYFLEKDKEKLQDFCDKAIGYAKRLASLHIVYKEFVVFVFDTVIGWYETLEDDTKVENYTENMEEYKKSRPESSAYPNTHFV